MTSRIEGCRLTHGRIMSDVSSERLRGSRHTSGVAPARRRQPLSSGNRLRWRPFNEITRSQFTAVRVGRYRGIDGLLLDSPGRVNLIVGVNNSGKTSLLEAIYLLAHQSDEQALLDVIRWRGRVEGDPEPP